MSDDLIKRSDAIAEIYKVRTPDVVSHHYAELFINAVCRAPSADRPGAVDLSSVYSTAFKSGYEKGKADRPQGWIPCSERLPEVHEEPYYADHEEILHESDHVLTCCKHGKGFVYAIGTVIHDEVCDSYEWSDLYDYADCVIDDMQVLAWMPLPKPWKGADDE